MGIGTSSRAHYRPLSGGFSRSPSFLVAALTIGFFIIAFSYWRLALQYHDLEVQLKHIVQRKDSLEASQNVINKQLEQREENFSEAKVSLQKKEQQVEDLQKKITETEKELKEIRVNVDSMKQSNEKLKTELSEKERNIELIRAQNKKLEEDKIKIEDELKKLQKVQPSKSNTIVEPVKPISSQAPSIIDPEKTKMFLDNFKKKLQPIDKNAIKEAIQKQSPTNQLPAPSVDAVKKIPVQSQINSYSDNKNRDSDIL